MGKMNNILVLVLLVVVGVGQTPTEGLYITSLAGFEGQERIVAYYDLDRDHYTDVLTYSPSQHSLILYLWKPSQHLFHQQANTVMNHHLHEVMVTDINSDGVIDVVVMVVDETQLPVIHNHILWYVMEETFQLRQVELNLPEVDSWLLSVVTIQNVPHLLYVAQGSLHALVFSDPSTYTSQPFCNVTLPFPHQLLLADIDGDCVQDILLLHVDAITFIKGQQNGTFAPPTDYTLQQTLINGYVADVDANGMIDLVMIVGDEHEQHLQIHYNTIKVNRLNICAHQSEGLPYDLSISTDKVSLLQRLTLPFHNPPSLPIIRMNDLNNDGYPDLIVDGGYNATFVFMNARCAQACGLDNPALASKYQFLNLRHFVQYNQHIRGSWQGRTLCGLSFLDIRQDGKMDLMGNFCPAEKQIGVVVPIINTFHLDAFFIKTVIYHNPIYPAPPNMSLLNLNGGHLSFYVTRLNGERVPLTANQKTQHGNALELPYIMMGLGRTNNYLENMQVMVPVNPPTSRTWTPIIPNSQVTVKMGEEWELRTFISPTSKMSWVFFGVVLVLVAIALVIMYLSQQQKKQDKENEQSFFTILR